MSQLALGLALRDEGLAATLAADQAVHRRFYELAKPVVDRLVASGQPWTIETVRELLCGAEPHCPNVWGALVGSRSDIVEIDRVRSPRPERHGARISVWLAKSAATHALLSAS